MEGTAFSAILICAVRYCLGRRTYMPELVTEWIESQYNSGKIKIDKNDLRIMLEDIENHERKYSLGDSCDIIIWYKFKRFLKREIDADAKDV